MTWASISALADAFKDMPLSSKAVMKTKKKKKQGIRAGKEKKNIL